jgi:hypothetical protein
VYAFFTLCIPTYSPVGLEKRLFPTQSTLKRNARFIPMAESQGLSRAGMGKEGDKRAGLGGDE